HTAALKGNGTVVAWGTSFYGETTVPADLSEATAIGAGTYHTLALAPVPTPYALTVGRLAERTVIRKLPSAVGSAVSVVELTFTGGTGSIEAAVNAGGTGWSMAKRYVIPIRYNPANGVWSRVLPTHETGSSSGNNFNLEINISGATALLRLRTVVSDGNA